MVMEMERAALDNFRLMAYESEVLLALKHFGPPATDEQAAAVKRGFDLLHIEQEQRDAFMRWVKGDA